MQKQSLHLLAAGMILFACPAQAQQLSYGIEGGLNRSTQLLYDPQKPADGTTQLNPNPGFYIGGYATASKLFHNKVLDLFSYKTRLSYARRGSVQSAQFMELPAPAFPGSITQVVSPTQTDIKNTLHYITLDLIAQKHILRFGKKSALFVEGGIGHNLLLSSDVQAGEIIGSSYPYNAYNNRNTKLYHLSWIAGLGVNIEDRFSLFIESDKALTPVHRSAQLRVKDWSWSLGASLAIGDWQRKQAVRTDRALP